MPLVPSPPQPSGVPWPTAEWPEGDPPPTVADQLGQLVDAMFTDVERYETTYAVLVAHHGRIVAERYGGELEHWDRPNEPVHRDTTLLSWSKAKSVLHAAVGMLVAEGRLDPDAPADVPAWQGDADPRRAITLEHLLTMRDGLRWAEDYVDAGVSDVIEMLFGSGTADVAAFAESRSLAHPPGEVFNYSSGTTNIVSAIASRALGGDPGVVATFLQERLFAPIGMRSAEARSDDAGTFVGSSYVYATARDFARFGTLYLRDGVWDGERILPEGWVDHGRAARPGSVDPETGNLYGGHWWVVGDDLGSYWANGYQGQSTLVCPGLDLVAVRMGRTDAANYPHLKAWRAAVVDAFRSA